MTERTALLRARVFLGPRAIVRRTTDREPCRVLRVELTIGGVRHEREYGKGGTWETALRRAEKAYEAMVRTAKIRKVG